MGVFWFLSFSFARYPVFGPLPSLRVRHLHRRMLKGIRRHADEGAADFAVQCDFGGADEVDDDACAVGAVFDFEFGADVYGSVAESAGFDGEVADFLFLRNGTKSDGPMRVGRA